MTSIEILAFVFISILFLILVYITVRLISTKAWRAPDPLTQEINRLCEHLRTIGIRASILTILTMGFWGIKGGVKGQPQWRWEKVLAVIKLEGRDIDSINFIIVGYYSVAALDFIVKTPSLDSGKKGRNTKLIMKRSTGGCLLTFINIWSAKVVDVEWRGGTDLARKLNLDHRLKDRLLHANLKPLRGFLHIVPEPEYGCVKIRTNHFLPTMELFNILETIAKHVKSV